MEPELTTSTPLKLMEPELTTSKPVETFDGWRRTKPQQSSEPASITKDKEESDNENNWRPKNNQLGLHQFLEPSTDKKDIKERLARWM